MSKETAYNKIRRLLDELDNHDIVNLMDLLYENYEYLWSEFILNKVMEPLNE